MIANTGQLVSLALATQGFMFDEDGQKQEVVAVSRRTARFPKKRRAEIGKTLMNLKRTKPNLSDDEREALAIKITALR